MEDAGHSGHRHRTAWSAAALSVAVDATSATGGTLFLTVEDGTTANNGIFAASYTITGSGTTQAPRSARDRDALRRRRGRLSHGHRARSERLNGTVTGNGTLFISSVNGGVYAGNMATDATLTARR